VQLKYILQYILLLLLFAIKKVTAAGVTKLHETHQFIADTDHINLLGENINITQVTEISLVTCMQVCPKT
jgi:hypothetical protein